MANPRFVIKAVISGQRLNINIPLTVAGTLNYIGVEAKCTSEWDDCTVICYIMNAAGNRLRLALTYDRERDIYFFPSSELLTLGAGEWSIYFVGVQANNGEISYRVTTEPRTFTIAYNILYSDVPPEQIPIYEQAMAIANDAKNTADELYQMYLDGDLKGDKGDDGDPAEIGFVQASVDNTTSNPRCTVTVTENPENTYNMQFDFKGIKGAKGDKGDKGDTGDTGPQGAPGRDGTNGRDGQTIDDYVVVQENEPSSPTTKMWLKPSPSGNAIEIPTMEELVYAFPVGMSVGQGFTPLTDGANNIPLKTLVAQITPIQAGSGDPSPSNVRPISGWTEASIYREAAYDETASPITEISFPTPPGTVYRGRLTINDDGTGELVVQKVKLVLTGSENWGMISAGIYMLESTLPSSYRLDAGDDWLCNKYSVVSGINTSSDMASKPDDSITNQPRSTYYRRVYVKDSAYSTVEDFKASLSTTNLEIIYSLPSPDTYSLTAAQITTLLGANAIWADCGDVYVEYHRDPTLSIADIGTYIDARETNIRRTIAPIENGITASQAYSQGAYFYHNNYFCKAKTAIASGATFTLNTNYEVTTVAAELFAAINP